MNKGLLLIAHGTKNEERNRVLSGFMSASCDNMKQYFDFTGWSFLEAEPSIPVEINRMKLQGIENCLVIPLFLAPSTHYSRDIPYLLEQEAQSILFTLSKPYMYSSFLKKSLLAQAKTLSVFPGEEGIILFAHGSGDYKDYWDRMMAETGDYIVKNTGIPFFNFAYIKSGKYLSDVGKELIGQEMQSVNRLIVLGMYFGKSILEIYYSQKDQFPKYFDTYRNEGRLGFSKYNLLNGDFVNLWVGDLVKEYLRIKIEFNN